MPLALKCLIALLVLSAVDVLLYKASSAKSLGMLLRLTSCQPTKIQGNASKMSKASWK